MMGIVMGISLHNPPKLTMSNEKFLSARCDVAPYAAVRLHAADWGASGGFGAVGRVLALARCERTSSLLPS